jgi:hypothetical protein
MSKQNYSFNAVTKVAKTATYTVLVTDEEINVTPAANSTLTLPSIADLASNGYGAKAYKITKEGTGRYHVKICAATGDKINLGGASQDHIFLSSNGEAVVIQSDPVMRKWFVRMQNMDKFVSVALGGRHDANLSIDLTGITAGQYNGVEWNVAGPDGVCAALTSHTGFRLNFNVQGTTMVTARTAFMGMYTHGTDQQITGNCTVLELELGEAAALGSQVSAVLTMCTRSARAATSYHPNSGYITIRDYSTGSGGPIPNFLSLMNSAMGWTVPATDVNALFTTSSDQAQTHALKMRAGAVDYWIMVTTDTPD